MDVANHSCLGYTETVFPRLSRHTVFLNSTKLFILWKCKNLKRFFFSLSHRTFYLSNQKTSTHLLDFLSSCLPPSWNTMYLKPRFHSNRKPEVRIMQSVYGFTILGDPGAVSRVDKMFVVKVFCKIDPTNCPWVSEDVASLMQTYG